MELKKKKDEFLQENLRERLRKLIQSNRQMESKPDPEELDFEFHHHLTDIKIQIIKIKTDQLSGIDTIKVFKSISEFFVSHIQSLSENYQFVLEDQLLNEIITINIPQLSALREEILQELLILLVVITSSNSKLVKEALKFEITVKFKDVILTSELFPTFLLLVQNISEVSPEEGVVMLIDKPELSQILSTSVPISDHFRLWHYLSELLHMLSSTKYKNQNMSQKLFCLTQYVSLTDLPDDLMILNIEALKKMISNISETNFEFNVTELYSKSSRIWRNNTDKKLHKSLFSFWQNVITHFQTNKKIIEPSFFTLLAEDLRAVSPINSKNAPQSIALPFFYFFSEITKNVRLNTKTAQIVISSSLKYFSYYFAENNMKFLNDFFIFISDTLGQCNIETQLNMVTMNMELIDIIFDVCNSEFDEDTCMQAISFLNQLLEIDTFLFKQTNQNIVLDYVLDKNYDFVLESLIVNGKGKLSLLCQLIIEKYFLAGESGNGF